MVRANASPYGLGGFVWSNDDVHEARGLALGFDAATVWVNKHLDFAPSIPFAGAK